MKRKVENYWQKVWNGFLSIVAFSQENLLHVEIFDAEAVAPYLTFIVSPVIIFIILFLYKKSLPRDFLQTFSIK
jgi:hypothetical protein